MGVDTSQLKENQVRKQALFRLTSGSLIRQTLISCRSSRLLFDALYFLPRRPILKFLGNFCVKIKIWCYQEPGSPREQQAERDQRRRLSVGDNRELEMFSRNKAEDKHLPATVHAALPGTQLVAFSKKANEGSHPGTVLTNSNFMVLKL